MQEPEGCPEIFGARLTGDTGSGGMEARRHTGDIVVCGVLPDYQHNGVGRALYCAVEEYFAQNSCEYVVVKTLSDLAAFEPYERTRSFYKSIGFVPLITLTEMWDENNPCLIMLKALKESCPQAI